MSFMFVSGSLALDFAGTAKSRVLDPVDVLATPADLADWVVAAGLLDSAPRCTPYDLTRAVELREAAYRLAHSIAFDESWVATDRTTVNEFARGLLPVVTLGSDLQVTRTGHIGSALTAIARDAIELVGGEYLIKECGRAECTRLYVDTSRGGARRWCDMAICGNRMKARRHYHRSRG